jgi:hypothetical protein
MSNRYDTISATLVLGSRDTISLAGKLETFRNVAEADYAAILDESGTVLVEAIEKAPQENPLVLGALANAAFGAVQELSRRLGDAKGDGFIYQGETTHFSIAPLTETAHLLTLFGSHTPIGIVRSALSQWRPVLAELLTLASSTPTAEEEPFEEGDIRLNLDDTISLAS